MNSRENNSFLDRIFVIYEDNLRQIEELQRLNTRILNLFINQVSVVPATVGSSANPSLWTSNASVNTFMRNRSRPNVVELESESDEEDVALSEVDINLNVTFYNNENPELICPITLQNINGQAARINGCNHIFSEEALRRWFILHNTCPVCRHRVGAGATQNRSNTSRVGEPNPRSSDFYNQLDSIFTLFGPTANTRLREISEEDINHLTTTLQTFLSDRRVSSTASASASLPSILSSILQQPTGNNGIWMSEFLDITSNGGPSRETREVMLERIRNNSGQNGNI